MAYRCDEIRNCRVMSNSCSCSPGRHFVVVTDVGYYCGHCNALVFLRPGDLADHDFSCESGIVTWFSRPLQMATHRCGQDGVAEAVEQLIDLTRTVGV